MSTTFLLLVWAVVGPIWAILFARKNPRISGWIAKEAKTAQAAAEAKVAVMEKQIEELTAKIGK